MPAVDSDEFLPKLGMGKRLWTKSNKEKQPDGMFCPSPPRLLGIEHKVGTFPYTTRAQASSSLPMGPGQENAGLQ